MEKNKKISLIVASIAFVVFFSLAFIVNWRESSFLYGVANGLISGPIMGVAAYFIAKAMISVSRKVSFRWWQWIFYAIGWIFGFASLLFWIIMLIMFAVKDDGKPFFNSDFHERVVIWGVAMSGFLLLGLIGLFLDQFTV